MEKRVGYVLNADIRRKWQQQIKKAEEAIAMYNSPIKFFVAENQDQVYMQMENGVLKALQDVDIIVDKAELLKALAYDREQYQKGYADGREAGHKWISVEDGLPEEPCDVLVVLYCNAVCIAWYNGTGWFETFHGTRFRAGGWSFPLDAAARTAGGSIACTQLQWCM